jgi:carboxylate-amine ligase
VYPKPRYQWMYEEYRQLVVEQQVCACQVHVSVPDRDLAVRVCRRVRAWLPVLLALSASSPMFRGADTGYASYRTVALSRWPTVGPPPDFDSAKEYDEEVSTLVNSGVISDAGMIYYDARPSARYPTVEIRVADSCPLVDDVVLLACLCRALVLTAAAEDRGGKALPSTSPVLLRASTWRAARSGLDADLVDPASLRPAPARLLVAALLTYLRPALEHLGDWDTTTELSQNLMGRGTSSHRQRDLLSASASDADIVRAIVAETTAC